MLEVLKSGRACAAFPAMTHYQATPAETCLSGQVIANTPEEAVPVAAELSAQLLAKTALGLKSSSHRRRRPQCIGP